MSIFKSQTGNYTGTHQKYLTLDEIIYNIYTNSKLSQDEYNKITSPMYNDIRTILENYCELIKCDAKIKLHGSYSLNTIMKYPTGDIDLDIGMIFNYMPNVTPLQLKNSLYEYLINKLPDLKNNIDIGKCAITITLKNMHIDIVMYKEVFGNQYVCWKNDWKQDEKDKQYEKLKDIILGNDSVKQIICFLKFLYKSDLIESNGRLPNIAITEYVVQDYSTKLKNFKNNHKRYKKEETIHKKFIEKEYKNIGHKTMSLLDDLYNDLNNKFEIKNSGCNENLIYNKKRKLNKKKTLNVIEMIRKNLVNYYNYQCVGPNDMILVNVLCGANKMLVLPKDTYDKYKKSNYKNTHVFVKEFNKCIKCE